MGPGNYRAPVPLRYEPVKAIEEQATAPERPRSPSEPYKRQYSAMKVTLPKKRLWRNERSSEMADVEGDLAITSSEVEEEEEEEDEEMYYAEQTSRALEQQRSWMGRKDYEDDDGGSSTGITGGVQEIVLF
ncbi:unnamed protein product [Allacma fusca]|uniref:Uncharacterized protein n=1 Tax=Allacma fusca TaxID=39272 RepID=A0A8J2PML5_9HEXA|nr:unnamed protein product [Allacma fusca]